MPGWLTAIAVVSLLLGIGSAAWLLLDVRRYPPKMGVMAVVWPVCGLFLGPALIWFYRRTSRADGSSEQQPSMAVSVARGCLHCGAGCTIGDLIAETWAYLYPAVLIPFGYPGFFGKPMYATWILDFILAFGFGIAFQYFAIVPMRGLSFWPGVRAALKADSLSLLSWQIGMYGFMAIMVNLVYLPRFGFAPTAASPVFWFTMQFAMIAGFVTAFPMNWFLIRRGIKERM